MTDPIREAFEQDTTPGDSRESVFVAGWHAGRADLLAEQEAAGPVVKFSPQVAFTQPTVNKIGDMPRLQPRVVLDDAQPAITDEEILKFAGEHGLVYATQARLIAFARALLERKP